MTRPTGLAVLLLVLAGCGGSPPAPPRGGDGSGYRPAAPQQIANGPTRTVDPVARPAFEPPAQEQFPAAKRAAAAIARGVTTYAPGATAESLARALDVPAARRRSFAATIRPFVHRGVRSAGEVIYPQLSGVTPSTLGTMVVVRQLLEDMRGRRRSETRVLDIRLRRVAGRWTLDRIATVGGRPRRRPASLPTAAATVVDHPRITLTDSARWDIYGGGVDRALLRRLAELAKRHPISVAVLRSGHPRNVWATSRRSAHTSGFAADIYAVGGRLVVRQAGRGTAAFQVARAAVAGGARQVGSPWELGPGSFTDEVHADHIHVQQRPVASPAS